MREALSLAVAGDLVPTRRLFRRAGKRQSGFHETADLLDGADVAFGDLEMPLSRAGRPRDKLITFRASPLLAADLSQLGFDVLSLANNHSLDFGYEAMFDTMRALRRQSISHVGAGNDLDEAEAPVVLTIKGWRVGFLAWSCLLPNGAAASAERPGIAPIHVHTAYEVDAASQMEEPGMPAVARTWLDIEDQRRAVHRIKDIRNEVDFLAVSIHWGYGSGELLADYQQPLGRALIDAGADVVLGNHVHAIQGVETYCGKAILYSPGNFIAQQPRQGASPRALQVYSEMSTDGYVAWLDVTSDAGYRVRLIPTITDTDGLPSKAHGEDFSRIAIRITRLSETLHTDILVDAGKEVVNLVRSK